LVVVFLFQGEAAAGRNDCDLAAVVDAKFSGQGSDLHGIGGAVDAIFGGVVIGADRYGVGLQLHALGGVDLHRARVQSEGVAEIVDSGVGAD